MNGLLISPKGKERCNMIALFYIGVILVSFGVISMITSIVNEFLPYDDSKLKRISSVIVFIIGILTLVLIK